MRREVADMSPIQHETADARRRRRADIDEAFKMRHARLRTLRLHLGLTEQEMAARLGMSKRAYAAWETPERSTRGATLFSIRLAEQFDVSIDWIVIGGQPNGPQAPGGGPLPLPTRH
jgi:DNA-binding transcriptional regulator YiaG